MKSRHFSLERAGPVFQLSLSRFSALGTIGIPELRWPLHTQLPATSMPIPNVVGPCPPCVPRCNARTHICTPASICFVTFLQIEDVYARPPDAGGGPAVRGSEPARPQPVGGRGGVRI